MDVKLKKDWTMRWSYKTVHYDLKKEGILGNSFLDEPEIELSLNQYGKAGWELVSLLETLDGLVAVFKQPLDLDIRSFSSSSDSLERVSRLPKRPERKPQVSEPQVDEQPAFVIMDEDEEENVAEAVLLDDFEFEEDKVEEAAVKPPKPPVDIGMIRIE